MNRQACALIILALLVPVAARAGVLPEHTSGQFSAGQLALWGA